MSKRLTYSASVNDEYPYTRSTARWRMETEPNEEEPADESASGWKLFSYLTNGGRGDLDDISGTSRQDTREHRQTRFLMLSAVLFVLWLCLLVF